MEKIEISSSEKSDVYKELIPQIKSLTAYESDTIANLANIAAALKEAFGFFWVGFYLVKRDSKENKEVLVLGPFQGSVACTRIAYGKGVCGTAWKEQKTLVIPDVEKFPGHIACSSLSKSEIVVPVFQDNTVVAVLDIDSDELNSFDQTDALYLKEMLSGLIINNV
ncbi:MAG: GAF domain-containing protein [Bacteroidales bacterium]|nr:GAF domain-containing protein [Bacteroidales bacterium]